MFFKKPIFLHWNFTLESRMEEKPSGAPLFLMVNPGVLSPKQQSQRAEGSPPRLP